jgi:hypothetical protein
MHYLSKKRLYQNKFVLENTQVLIDAMIDALEYYSDYLSIKPDPEEDLDYEIYFKNIPLYNYFVSLILTTLNSVPTDVLNIIIGYVYNDLLKTIVLRFRSHGLIQFMDNNNHVFGACKLFERTKNESDTDEIIYYFYATLFPKEYKYTKLFNNHTERVLKKYISQRSTKCNYLQHNMTTKIPKKFKPKRKNFKYVVLRQLYKLMHETIQNSKSRIKLCHVAIKRFR